MHVLFAGGTRSFLGLICATESVILDNELFFELVCRLQANLRWVLVLHSIIYGICNNSCKLNIKTWHLNFFRCLELCTSVTMQALSLCFIFISRMLVHRFYLKSVQTKFSRLCLIICLGRKARFKKKMKKKSNPYGTRSRP